MENKKKGLPVWVWVVLACVIVIAGIVAALFLIDFDKEEPVETTAEEVVQEVETVPVSSKPPVATKSDPNAESLQSTPNKGGNKKVVSGTTSVKSEYSKAQEAVRAALNGLEANKAKTIEQRRNYAEAYMRAMLTVQWTLQKRPATQVSNAKGEKTYYLHDYASEDAWKAAFEGQELQDEDTYNYVVAYGKTYNFKMSTGRVYCGLPFSQGSSGLESFNLLVKEKDANGVSVMDTRFDTYYLYGGPGLIGNTYDTALIYAWNTVSYSSRAREIANMVPTNGYYFVEGVKLPEYTEEERQAAASKPPVPDHDNVLVGAGVADKLYHLIDDGSLSGNTDEITAFNGEQGMYAAYANAKKADGLIRSDGTSNARMIVSVHVVKNPDGSIDGDQSYVITLAQTTQITEKQQADGTTLYCFGEVDAKYTFKSLYEDHFVPMTVKELNDGTADDAGAMVRDQYEYSSRRTGSYIYSGIINGSRRILWVNTVITDEAGNELFNNTAFAEKSDILLPSTTESGRYTFNLAKLDDSQEKVTSLGTDVISNSALGKGTFHYTVTAHMITGEDIVVRDYTYTNN